MSVEADTNVPTSGDIGSFPTIHDEAHDAPIDSKENIQPKECLDAVETKGKAREDVVTETNDPLSNLRSIVNISEAPLDGDVALKVNGDSSNMELVMQSDAADSGKPLLERISSVENVVTEPKEVVLSVDHPAEKLEQEKDNTGGSESADSVTVVDSKVTSITTQETVLPSIEVLQEEAVVSGAE
ncbi:hypothetical protein H0H93_010529, partial [Arthromyces matolae]